MQPKTILLGILSVFFLANYVEAAIYQWKDKSGNMHLTDNYNKVPIQYRSQLKVTEESKGQSSVKRTVVKFRRDGSSILVNATLNYTLPVVFHLDTGATNTMILKEDAVSLGLNLKGAHTIKSRIADGSVVDFPTVKLNSIQVGEAEVRNIKVTIGKVRLLGLNFLKNFKVIFDAESENVILDAPEHIMRAESDSIRAEKKRAVNEYEIKIQKANIQIKTIKKNIELQELQIEEYEDKKFELETRLNEAVERNASQSTIDKLENFIRQYDLAIESRQLNLETYAKDIDVLKNNIEFYEQQIRKLR